MNYLLAKLKGRGVGKYGVLLSDVDVYDFNINNYASVSYEPDHKLDGDCWFKIDDFLAQDFCIAFLKQAFVAADYQQLGARDLSKIAFICSIQNGDYFFQKVTPSTLIRRKMISMGAQVELEENSPKIIINEAPDALYVANQDALYFRSLSAISTIFRGVEVLFKEATQEEASDFLSQPFISVNNDYGVDKVGKFNRKRIAMAVETLGRLDGKTKSKLFSYVSKYCPTLKYDKKLEIFDVGSEDELKNLLYGIEERYYTTLHGKEKRLANSVVSLP
ncbi:ATP F0F1 synthase synthase [Pseudomonas seleniipraecipitans]|uniref:ATP F0F1 synthase synthase n=1 Tax=Phytopseudomonas seleniipraecipitans TaxID=640205 RepID=A0ABY5JAN2_9GAMM|nr:ATP F0F1 synthase synthase [Pseudomonas seleniipraecipitans]UUD65057.1 ATP F0F1 synthase synthase [Pseudomonas seleniipraecipitans]